MKVLKDKIIITAKIHVITGMHIGAGYTNSAIGAVDDIVIRDPLTFQPIIPGSSIKGKLRYLLESEGLTESQCEHIKELFGGSDCPYRESKLMFSDCFLTPESEKRLRNANTELSYTEIKYENTIERIELKATPRQQERVIAGSEFCFLVIYNLYSEEDVKKDFEVIAKGFELLHYDYLGGSGTRGYGRVAFLNFEVKSLKDNDTTEYKELLSHVKDNPLYKAIV